MDDLVNWLVLAEEVIKTDIIDAFTVIDNMPVEDSIKYKAFKLYLVQNYALNTSSIMKED